ncbi:hypothetical protein AALO_G00146870 [Alosa alosa]|uniref:Uncharacterized protein n=1 Tax=Alosa alosa TaxID=278164 RepID=A0AAV6GHV3_9TELE|nr:hypothetical protein AALO_G00146870 [Alosa alosa]
MYLNYWVESSIFPVVVLPALCHLTRVMVPSDDDPVYVVKFKNTFTADFARRKESTNLPWLKIATVCDPRFKDLKCLPKDERNEVWASVRNLMLEEKPAKASLSEKTETTPAKKQKSSFR